jgi:hypothetical protein
MENKYPKENKSLTRIDLIHYLLNNGKISYLPNEFNTGLFIDTLMDWLLTSIKVEALYLKEDELHTIEYVHKAGISNSLGLSMSFKLFMVIDQQKLFYDIKPEKWFGSKDGSFSIASLVNEPRDKEIQEFIFVYILRLIGPPDPLKFDTRNHFIDKISEQKRIWFYTQFPVNEQLFVFLDISKVKKANGILNTDKELEWHVVFSSNHASLVSFNKRGLLAQKRDILPGSFRVKNELGRNPVYVNDCKLLSTRANAELFYHIQHLYMLKPLDKIRETVRLNWLYQEKHLHSNQFAIELQRMLVLQTADPFDEFSLLYMEYTGGNREKVFIEYTGDEKLLNLLHRILDHSDTFEILTLWIKKWDISYFDSVVLNNLLTKAIENAVQANNILPFHRYVRENFFKKHKEEIDKIVFDLGFAKHLIRAGLANEAKKLLLKRLSQLPDETVSDLLPPKNMDLTGKAAGQILKISILEILAGLETEKNAIADKCQIARLQPLVDERVDQIISVSDTKLADKARELKKLMGPAGLTPPNTTYPAYSYKPINQDIIEKNVRHPASRKNGGFSNLQKWIASVKVPDLSVLKSYTEKMSPQKYPELNAIVTDIKYALNLENIEVYISQGDKSTGITSFESVPQFLIVGGDHLEKDSPNYLNYQELRFAVGLELAHLYFKHSRITSGELWKGIYEKGYFVVDALLSIFPAVGLFSKSLQSIIRLNEISSYLQKAEKLGKVSSKSRDIIKSTEQVVNIYKSKFTKGKASEKEMEFLATFRIIQMTAVRTALLFTKDLKSAIRSLFLISRRYYTDLPVVEKYGLKNYLLKKDENENYQHQELAIQLADLFSFYLSDEYEQTIKLLESK